MGLTYRDAGVDIDAGEELVRRIGPLAAATRRQGVLGGIGGFGGLFGLKETGYQDPVLVSGTDGVGTKLMVAFMADRHDTVGIDLVAMCVNDVLTIGAEPLFFLDYFATGHLEPATGEAVVAGIAEGCRQAGCALLGGETAEMPGMYAEGEYDLAGFCVGVVERAALDAKRAPVQGDILLGLPSSGLHSNGYSLARRALFDQLDLSLDDAVGGSSLGAVMMAPTRIYVKPVLSALAAHGEGIRAMAHITGGGLVDNLPRVLPEGLSAEVDYGTWDEPAIFDLIREAGVDEVEMRRTFNLGIGYVLVVAPEALDAVAGALSEAGEAPVVIGRVAP
ncbi:MAG: phosphoribosylformylglycinamidine cyclo-ligase [Myxococcota bacterium]|jgi:phosphoribosylformylglycinamidine cyclo-ligase|nr:phosphoribosylformylglycinamidine cyclo-ligase [Myxococcota bacterium]